MQVTSRSAVSTPSAGAKRLLCPAIQNPISLHKAKELDYYVLLEGMEALSSQDAESFAKILMDRENPLCFDGLILSAYIGSDALKPYLSLLKDSGKDLFVVVRTANKTAAELQDLLTGTRLMHMAKADMVNRFTQPLVGRSG